VAQYENTNVSVCVGVCVWEHIEWQANLSETPTLSLRKKEKKICIIEKYFSRGLIVIP
jgi:hypothetical protein